MPNRSTQLFFLAVAFLFAGVVGAHIIYILLVAMVIIAVVRVVRRQPIWIAQDKASLFFFLAFLLFSLSFVLSANEVADTIFALNYFPLLLFSPLAAFLAAEVDRRNTVAVSWLAFAGLVIILAVAGVQVVALGVGRAEGFEIDPIAMGHTAIMLGFIAVIGFPVVKSWPRYLLLAAPVLGIVGALLTGSRGPVLAAVFLVPITMIFLTRRPIASLVITVFGSVAIGVCLYVFWPSAFSRLETFYGMAVSLVTEGTVGEESAGLRLEMYYGAIQAFLQSPWYGYGWENKFSALASFFPSDWDGFNGHHHLHADLADTAVASGLIGLVAYALIIAAPIAGALSSPQDSQYRGRLYMAVLLSVGYFGFGLTYLLFGYEYHTTLYVILAAAIVGYARDEPPVRAVASEIQKQVEESNAR